VDERSQAPAAGCRFVAMVARAVGALLLVLAAVPVLAGCGSDDLRAEGVAKAAEATASKGGAKVALRQTVTAPGRGTISTRGAGVVDAQARKGHMTLTTSGGPGLPANGRDATQEFIFDGFTIYVRSPQLASLLPGRAEWLKIDAAKLSEAAGLDLAVLAQSAQDPSQSMQVLEAVSGDVRKLGGEQVRGVDTTHYRATVDLRKYPSVVPEASRAAAEATVDKTIQLTGTRMIPVEVWIDGDNLVRRLEQKLAAQGMPITQRIELYDFGTNVDVEPPPARKVKDLTDIASLAGSSGTSSAGTATP
jgi:hypothetical protein